MDNVDESAVLAVGAGGTRSNTSDSRSGAFWAFLPKTMPAPNPQLQELAILLEKRLAVIADHEFRDRDPDAHLNQLREVSETLIAKHQELKPEIDARLNHFLENCSYDKALDWTQGLLAK